MNILIVNGVNLKQIGTREINVYGAVSFEDYLPTLRLCFPNVNITLFQSDVEGEIARQITRSVKCSGIILNPGAYTHTSVILADAVRAISIPVIEVHITNLFGREQYRRISQLSSACDGFISGFGLDGYRLAIEAILQKKMIDN